MSTWQNMLTAPRDGRKVLIYMDKSFAHDPRIGPDRAVIAHWHGAVHGYGNWETDSYNIIIGDKDALFWQPLPAAPQEVASTHDLEILIKDLTEKVVDLQNKVNVFTEVRLPPYADELN